MLITGFYAAIVAVLLVFLSGRVVNHRRRNQVSVGTAGNVDIERAMRVQANLTEYAPLALLMLAMAEANGLNSLAVHGIGIALLGARFAHFIGFSQSTSPMIFRVIGTASTFLVLVILAIVLIWQFLTGAA